MFRLQTTPRYDWQTTVVNQGMNFHTIKDKVYWDESICYELNESFVDKIEEATNTLHGMCISYVHDCISRHDYSGYFFENRPDIIYLIEKSWEMNHPSFYGRFDFGVDKAGNLKMFEYNADTPTGLLEASIIQWNWKEDLYPEQDQFNSIHEHCIAAWQAINQNGIYFTAMTNSPKEDWSNIHYILDTYNKAGYNGSSIDLEMVGWKKSTSQFVDMKDKNIGHIFKLYPWEWLVNDQFFEHIKNSSTMFIEPAWKMLLSNKLLCVKLWERHPNHPNLLESHNDNKRAGEKQWIQKPMLGREGEGVDDCNYQVPLMPGNIVQEKMDVMSFDGFLPTIGSWVINGESCGIGIREERGITTNNSRFVPHYFVKD